MLNAPDVLCVLNVLNVLKDTSLACWTLFSHSDNDGEGENRFKSYHFKEEDWEKEEDEEEVRKMG